MNKILIDRSTVEQALKALENCGGLTKDDAIQRVAAITALKAALAEPVQEPDSPERRCGGPGCDMTCCQPVAQRGAMFHTHPAVERQRSVEAAVRPACGVDPAAKAETVQEPAPMPPFPPVSLWKRGCAVCGLGADGKAYGYACPRSDCPTRVTCGGTV